MERFPDGYVHDLSEEAIANLRSKIPDHILAGLDDYVRDRLPSGGFLTALLENDLRGAVERADLESMAALYELVIYCENCLPSPCWGSPAKVSRWLKERAL